MTAAAAATEATAEGAEGTELGEVIEAELVDDDAAVRLLPATVAGGAPTYRITRDTLLVEGELPPRVDEQPAFTKRDFTVPPSAKRRAEERGARNTRVNRGTTRDRFEEWCVKEGRIARPATTTANVVAYFDHLMESGKKGGSQYSPDSLLAYLSRIVTLQIVRRVQAWLGDLRELDADNPTFPLFRALSTTGNLKGRGNATVRGLHLSGSAINEIVKKRAAAAGVTYINGLKVTGHSLRAGPNTDMKRAKVPLADRREAGDWGEKSPLPDSRYNRPDDTVDATETDPLDAVPLFGKFKEETAGR